MIADGKWEGASLAAIIERELEAFSARLTVVGCDVIVSPAAAQSFALILHELATNATKYGALSTPGGQVVIEGKPEWINGRDEFVFQWVETGGPQIQTHERKGFGTSVLLDVARQFSHDVELKYEPSGVIYRLRAHLSAIKAASSEQQQQQSAG
jgi:two-component sensor histidine kinase